MGNVEPPGSPASRAAGERPVAVRFVDSIAEIGRDAWNSLAGTGNPFTRYEFLHALEATGCVGAASGWQPQHLALCDGADAAEYLAVVPLYGKTNGWGEYVFDWSWENAYRQHGLAYYPKSVTAAPFTPSAGPRLFGELSGHLPLVCEQIRQRTMGSGASSWHVLFPCAEQCERLRGQGMQIRHGTQFHWRNRGYRNFDGFLAALSSRKRKNLRRERRRIHEQGIGFTVTEGADISEAQWADFYLHYQSTYLQRGMAGYLSPQFFHAIGESMPGQLLLVNAQRSGREIAAALFFHNDETLFGRYWGCREEHEFLHFEACYYQGIDYAISKGLRRFDAGAQGEHKIQRGFEPVTTLSAHWLADAEFHRAIGDFVVQERAHVEAYQQAARRLLPYREMPDREAP